MRELNFRSKDTIHRKASLAKEGVEVLILLYLLQTLSVVLQSVSVVSAEPDEFVNLGTATTYYYETEADSVSYNATLNGQRSQTSWLHSFDTKVVEDPRLCFTTDLPVSDVGVPYPPESFLSRDSTYQWDFPDIEPGGSTSVTAVFDRNLVPGSFTTDFSASRTVTPNKIEYPGGTQTITLSATPRNPEFELLTVLGPYINLIVSLSDDDNVRTSFYSVTWPTVGETEMMDRNQTHNNVQCFIRNPRIGITYTLVVVISIVLKDGIRAVEYEPHSQVRDLVSETPTQTFYGRGNQTFVTSSGTWKWNTTSEHKWLTTAESTQQVIHFLPRVNLTLGHRVMIHDMPPGADFVAWVDKGGVFPSGYIPYSFVTENSTTCFYLSNYTRYRFIGWTGDYESASFTFKITGIDHSVLINANWVKEHRVTVQLSKDSGLMTAKQEWYAENATFQYGAERKVTKDFLYDYVLDRYTVNDVVHSELIISVSVSGPLNVIAYYRSEINIVNLSIVVLTLLVIAFTVAFLGMRKRETPTLSPAQSASSAC